MPKKSVAKAVVEPKTPTHKQSKEKYVFDPVALDTKYSKPNLMHNFKMFFGVHKGETFKQAYEDKDYIEYIHKLKPESISTNNMYLLRKYIAYRMEHDAKPTLKVESDSDLDM